MTPLLKTNVDICGKRGLGDLVSGTSHILQKLDNDTHLTYWLPPGFNYSETIQQIIDQYTRNFHLNITYSVDESWSSVSYKKALLKFNAAEENILWFFNEGNNPVGYNLKFNTVWQGNKNGPVGLCLNNENTNPGYPYPEKWFDKTINDFLLKLVDNKNYYFLGRPRTITENIDIMSKCRYILGTDGGWMHVANSMRVPAYLVRNGLSLKIIKATHIQHPTLKIIETKDFCKYLN